MSEATSISERRACALEGLTRDSWRHPPQRAQLDQVTSLRIVELAHERRRFGYRRIGDLLRAEGSDSLASGRRIKCLTVTDDFSHDCVGIPADHGIGGEYAVRMLEQVARFCGYPQAGRTDQGPEFIRRAFMA